MQQPMMEDLRWSGDAPAHAPPRSLDLSREAAAVWVKGLARTFESGKKAPKKTVVAVDGFDVGIGRGELFGILGTNGAG
jgi:ABC-type glutathione transport system ATPase component